VVLYVLVGKVFPTSLQPALFASFAAAWVLPALFGPALAAFIADQFGWRWVFLSAVGLAAISASLVAPSLRGLAPQEPGEPAPRSRLVWAVVAAVAVLAIDQFAVVAFPVVVLALFQLLPTGSMLARRGLPAIVAARGLMSASFFCSQAYIAFLLQENWDLSAGVAGLVLSFVGIVWALGSQVSARVGDRVSDAAGMVWGNTLLLVGTLALLGTIWADLPAAAAMAAFVVASAGMGFGYPRTGVAMLGASSDADRGFNSSALAMADSLGSALTLSLAGVVFTLASDGDREPFVAVFVLAAVVAALSVLSALRTGSRHHP
jgi:predicted MFS family arabinose efflux permease